MEKLSKTFVLPYARSLWEKVFDSERWINAQEKPHEERNVKLLRQTKSKKNQDPHTSLHIANEDDLKKRIEALGEKLKEHLVPVLSTAVLSGHMPYAALLPHIDPRAIETAEDKIAELKRLQPPPPFDPEEPF